MFKTIGIVILIVAMILVSIVSGGAAFGQDEPNQDWGSYYIPIVSDQPDKNAVQFYMDVNRNGLMDWHENVFIDGISHAELNWEINGQPYVLEGTLNRQGYFIHNYEHCTLAGGCNAVAYFYPNGTDGCWRSQWHAVDSEFIQLPMFFSTHEGTCAVQ